MLRSLQAGRAIAAILVLLYHLGRVIAAEKYFGIEAFAFPFSFGGVGVEFFFVLSGFIITRAHRNDLFSPQRFRAYLGKRLVRIYPTYWLIFASVYLTALALPALRETVPHDFLSITKALLLIPQLGPDLAATTAPVLIVAWTLQYEMLFYLLFGIFILNKQLSILTLGSFILFFGYFTIFPSHNFLITFLSSPFILLFAMGVCIAQWASWSHFTLRNATYYGGAGLLLLFGKILDTLILGNLLEDQEILIYGLASSLIILGLVKYEEHDRTFGAHPLIQSIGNASYVLYLLHVPFISLMAKILKELGLTDWGLTGAVLANFSMLILAVMTAVLIHRHIERPLLNRMRAFLPDDRSSTT